MRIHDNFNGLINHHWIQVATGGGALRTINSKLRLGFKSAKAGKYTDAQIDDYTMLPRPSFPWRSPLRMTVRARSSLPAATPKSTNKSKNILRGTAGFGFWNNPFSPEGNILALPEAIWFFYASPPSNMSLVPGIPGWGWKAQVVHTMRVGAFINAFPMLISTVFGQLIGNTQIASHFMQQMTGTHESILPIRMEQWHDYVLEWRIKEAIFWIDGKETFRTKHPPTRPLGFVAWIDNQYAIATPNGVFQLGTTDCSSQWIEMDSVQIKDL